MRAFFGRLAARRRRALAPGVEGMEGRALLATSTTFVAPSITDLVAGARNGVNTAPATIDRLLGALESQLNSGPLADLNSGAVDQAGYQTEVASLVTSFDQSISTLLANYPNVLELTTLAADAVPADVAALVQQQSVGLITTTTFATAAQTSINNLTSGPLRPLGTTIPALATRTQQFEAGLDTLASALGTSATIPLTISQVNTTLAADAAAYQAEMDSALTVTHPYAASVVDTAVATLESSVASIANGTSTSTASTQSQVQAAITAFDTTVLDTTGLFGPRGAIGRFASND
ncbi:MAG TPA: hypothetical protein VG406_10570 [Isosphaeraceae bacterium]|nr:hypothetical protein [Isosphaeraceae bacterium]